MEVDNLEFHERPKRGRRDSQRHVVDLNPDEKRNLGLTGVIHVLKSYDDFDGGINCCICGKLYKSKVCFTKHIWEHSVYWDEFKGEKNHDRVLSIQAALILYGHGNQIVATDNCSSDVSKMLPDLLVTAPNEKKKDINGNISPEKLTSPNKKTCSPTKRPSPRKSKSPAKRKKTVAASDSEGSVRMVSQANNDPMQKSQFTSIQP